MSPPGDPPLPEPGDIEAVVLDVGGVLVVPDPARVRAALHEAGVTHNADHETHVRAHYVAIAAADRSGPSDGDRRVYADAFAVALGVPAADLAAARDAVSAVVEGPVHGLWSRPVHTSVAAARRLRDAGVPLAIVSNADGTVADVLASGEIAQVGDGPGIDVVALVDSGVVGVAKPDPAIFDLALAALGIAAARCAHVGDSVRYDVGGARAAGLRPIHLDPLDLWAGADHPRVRDLGDLADHLLGAG